MPIYNITYKHTHIYTYYTGCLTEYTNIQHYIQHIYIIIDIIQDLPLKIPIHIHNIHTYIYIVILYRVSH